ncbi:MAG: 3'-5' exonuclease [Flavobacteriaceae bacterium]
MLHNLDLAKILFLDIETVPEESDYSTLSTYRQALWAEKTAYQRQDEISPEDFYERAGIWAEFGKIVCISVGFFDTSEPQNDSFRIKSFSGEEKHILQQFKSLCRNHFYLKSHLLCAHNGKEFDFPYIARRMIIHRIGLPKILNLFGKKPWEVPHLDTLQLWKFGDYKHYTSLKLLAEVLGIPTPKDDIDGSDVARVYYQEKNLDRIVRYCEKDVLTLAQVFLSFLQKPLLNTKQIVWLNQ